MSEYNKKIARGAWTATGELKAHTSSRRSASFLSCRVGSALRQWCDAVAETEDVGVVLGFGESSNAPQLDSSHIVGARSNSPNIPATMMTLNGLGGPEPGLGSGTPPMFITMGVPFASSYTSDSPTRPSLLEIRGHNFLPQNYNF